MWYFSSRKTLTWMFMKFLWYYSPHPLQFAMKYSLSDFTSSLKKISLQIQHIYKNRNGSAANDALIVFGNDEKYSNCKEIVITSLSLNGVFLLHVVILPQWVSLWNKIDSAENQWIWGWFFSTLNIWRIRCFRYTANNTSYKFFDFCKTDSCRIILSHHFIRAPTLWVYWFPFFKHAF